ncbi:metallophosphoesterase [Methanosarcina sp. Mfa9]|uniref:metallophosphoesterase n=1 Tax=Methanosarcina sp. Mfa9 TaxID=3439063 RepID=UPI003F8676A5
MLSGEFPNKDVIDKAAAKEALRALLPEANRIFNSEPSVLRIEEEPVMLVGDIHGNLEALEFILKMREEMGCKTLLFLGDYVDRGPQGVEVLVRLFRLKLEDPENVFLLRGNHETVEMNVYYGFFEEIGFDPLFLAGISRTYKKMPVGAVLSGHTFCVHGGITGVEDIEKITKENAFPYLWNDPSEKPGLGASRRGDTVKEYGPDLVDGFLKLNGLKRVIRAHTAIKDGYEWWFGGKLLSLFSCPDYVGFGNSGAFALFGDGKAGEVKIEKTGVKKEETGGREPGKKELKLFVFGNTKTETQNEEQGYSLLKSL